MLIDYKKKEVSPGMGVVMFIAFVLFIVAIYSTIRLIILVSKLTKSAKE